MYEMWYHNLWDDELPEGIHLDFPGGWVKIEGYLIHVYYLNEYANYASYYVDLHLGHLPKKR